MGKKIMVNWQKLNNLGNNTANYAEEFEKIRSNMESIIGSINSCWQGLDAENYITTTTNYLESLKQDTAYLYEISNYFKKSATVYNGGVNNGLSRVKSLESNYINNDDNEFMKGRLYE